MIKNIKKKKSVNPRLKIDKFVLPGGRQINVCQDGELIAGTKQRVVVKFVKHMLSKNPKIEYLVYAGICNGFGPVATAYAANKLKLKSIVFLARKENMTKGEIVSSRQISTIHALGGQIYLCNDYRSARLKEYEFASIVLSDKTWKDREEFLVLPMGLNDEKKVMVKMLAGQLKNAIKKTAIEKATNLRIWLVMGSGGIFEAIYKCFPGATYYVYITGGGRYVEQAKEIVRGKNVTILNYIKLTRPNSLRRSDYYESVAGYDDMIWDYLVEFGQNGDYIWNVASDKIG
jgi:hypothetical protein